MMISFDIFDTLITRKTALPTGIFLQVQMKEKLATDFCKMRIEAEKDARMYAIQSQKEEITLQNIYELLSKRLGKNMDSAMATEEQTELDNVYPLWSQIDILKEFVSQGENVVLISDMYLDERIIRQMLVKVDPVFEKIPIYVSCNYGKTKNSGKLFLKIAELENVKFKNWIHYGDNDYSDYLVPRMLGIQAIKIERQPMTVWEKTISEKLCLQENLLLQYCIGAAKTVRRENSLNSAAQIGCSLGGMILYPYVQWLLKLSAEMEIKRLYFMARDGYVLKKIADKIIQNQNLDIKTKYIYSSRKAWRLEKDEIEKRKILLQYLIQEIDFSDENFALVDLHGTGVTIEYLADVLKSYFSGKIKVFYFDLVEERECAHYELIPYCSEHTGPIELFCRAPHGATIGYELEGGVVKPNLKLIKDDIWRQAGLYDYIAGIELFAEVLSKWMKEIELNKGCELSEVALNYCTYMPDEETLHFLGDFPHCNGINEENVVYAPRLRWVDIFNIYVWRTIEPLEAYYHGCNLPISLMRTDKKYLKFKTFLEKHNDKVLGRIIHRIKIGKIFREKKRKKIVVYAAGEYGKAMYRHLIAHPNFFVSAWTDINYEKFSEKRLPVISLREALRKPYDYIVICINNELQIEAVRSILISQGVDAEQIKSYKEFVNTFLQ